MWIILSYLCSWKWAVILNQSIQNIKYMKMLSTFCFNINRTSSFYESLNIKYFILFICHFWWSMCSTLLKMGSCSFAWPRFSSAVIWNWHRRQNCPCTLWPFHTETGTASANKQNNKHQRICIAFHVNCIFSI